MDLRFWDTPHGAVRSIPIMGSAGPCHQAFRSFSPDKWRPAFLTNYFSGKWILTSRWFLPFRFLLQKILHFFKLRTCERAQWEIREVAEQMLALVKPIAPTIFAKAGPGCVSGPCPEGRMTCGKAVQVRKKYLQGEAE